MLKFNRNYFILSVVIFVIEVLIALYIRDNFVRPYIGDVLVVILIYCAIRSFLNVRVLPLAIFVLAFAFFIEFLQYVHIVEVLGLEKSKFARTVIGTQFVWNDLVAYVAGIVIVLVVEKFVVRKEL